MSKMPHVPSGWACCVAHYGPGMVLLPACHKCASCGEFIRPENMGEDCPGEPSDKPVIVEERHES